MKTIITETRTTSADTASNLRPASVCTNSARLAFSPGFSRIVQAVHKGWSGRGYTRC